MTRLRKNSARRRRSASWSEVAIVARQTSVDEDAIRDAPPPHAAGVNMTAYVHHALSEMIMSRKLRAGDRLVEQKLARQLASSRTPLREAMQRLEGEGLLRKSANRSYVVRQVDMREYLQSLRVRKILEAEAAALAAGRVSQEALAEARASVLALEKLRPYDTQAHWASDDMVHGLFLDACGNTIMAGILRDLRVTTRLFEIAQLAERLGPDSREHLAILDALERGDAEGARKAMADHAQSLFDFAIGTIS